MPFQQLHNPSLKAITCPRTTHNSTHMVKPTTIKTVKPLPKISVREIINNKPGIDKQH